MGVDRDLDAATAPAVSRSTPDWLILTLACVAQFMVLLDVSIVNVALPSIKHSLGFSQAELQWVLNAYTLTFAGFLLLGGRIADLFGRRRVFLLGLTVFTLASLLGGFAQDQAMLIAARAVQGLGGAILSPTTLTILTTTFREPKARARAMGVWSAVAGAGGATGALLGGILTQELSWRWILFINIPIGIVTFIVARLYLQESRAQGERQPLDVPGAVLVTAGLTALVFGVVRTTSVGWGSWQTLVALGLAVALVCWFLLHESRVARSPLMPLPLFRRRSIWTANLVMFLLSGALFAMWFFVSLYLQEVHGYTPLRTGFAFVPQTIAIIVGAQVSSRLVLRLGPRPILVVGGLLSALGLLLFSGLGIDTGYWSGFFVPSVLITLGLGLSFTPLAYAATAGIPPQEAGLASGLVNTSRQIGGAVGLAALATIATSRTHAVAAAVSGRLALTDGYTLAFRISAVIALGAAAAALLVPAKQARVGAAGPAPAPASTAEDAPKVPVIAPTTE
ncbi:MAG: MFS transporter [Acidimicrobiales bacterium]|jgi:EmrB/QacA subfamily drug resistance transporter